MRTGPKVFFCGSADILDMNTSIVQTASPLLALTGRKYAGPVAPVTQTMSARSNSSWTPRIRLLARLLFARHGGNAKPPLYGPDARLRGQEGEAKLKQFGPDQPTSEADMSTEDRALLDRLRARDALVRGHENAHVTTAGGQAAGPVQYSYQTGPDGQQYAIGGSVSIAVVSSPMNDEDAARQAGVAQRAAMAGGQASLRDMQVAMRAGELSGRARDRALGVCHAGARVAGRVSVWAGLE